MEKAILIHLSLDKERKSTAKESMEELKGLTRAAGASVVHELYQNRSSANPKYLIGSGKVSEIKDKKDQYQADLIIFNHILTAIQQRSLEDEIQGKIIDRTQLILDIFAQRARSKEGKLQVELAQLNYILPRLLGKGTALSRLGGGIGTRGPGEKKLEEDRRKIKNKITQINKEIKRIQKRRIDQRNIRKKSPAPVVALVGYTNAGKSTLFNRLSQENMFTSSLLFATLDPVIRRVSFSDGTYCFLSDTVGFIKDLPAELFTAFKATLEEVGEADCICHVIDITSPHCDSQIIAVENILGDLGIADIPMLRIFNKIDKLPEQSLYETKNNTNNSISAHISAQQDTGITDLKDKLHKLLFKDFRLYSLKIPKTDRHLLNSFPKWSLLLKQWQNNDNFEVQLMADPKKMIKYLPYIKKRGEANW